MTYGVPQGSVLGPILFLSYINDLLDRTRSKVRLFANDTAILSVSNLQDAQILQQDLDRLHEWVLKWDMEFNLSKCVVIHVTRAKTSVPSEYLLHGQILESVGGPKYLGWKSVTICLLTITSRKYAHQQDGPLDSSNAT